MAHLYGLNPIRPEAPRAPRMFVEPGDFATVAELALALSGCARVCIRLVNPETGEAQVAFFPETGTAGDLPAMLLPDGQGAIERRGAEVAQAMATAGLPKMALWIGFPLRSVEGRTLGVLGVMDVQERSLPEPVLAQLAHLAEILSRGIGMAASTIRTLARQSLGLIQDVAELQGDVASPAMTGLLRYAAGREPSAGEAIALRKAGLAELAEGVLRLTPMARDVLYIHGFRLPRRKT